MRPVHYITISYIINMRPVHDITISSIINMRPVHYITISCIINMRPVHYITISSIINMRPVHYRLVYLFLVPFVRTLRSVVVLMLHTSNLILTKSWYSVAATKCAVRILAARRILDTPSMSHDAVKHSWAKINNSVCSVNTGIEADCYNSVETMPTGMCCTGQNQISLERMSIVWLRCHLI